MFSQFLKGSWIHIENIPQIDTIGQIFSRCYGLNQKASRAFKSSYSVIFAIEVIIKQTY